MSDSFSNPFFWLFILYTLSVAVQFFYYLRFYLAPALYKHPATGGELPPVSVIICARNEAENLRKYLKTVLEQDYPSYEVIVVNDCSEDDTYRVLGEMAVKYPILKISNINRDPRFTHAKKFAQFIGIKAASNDILVFTDADCAPVSDKWLRLIVSRFTPGIDFVLGYGGYFTSRGFLNLYQRCETLFIAMQYIGMSIRGVPYMGVGRNLAYRKEVFFRNRGFGTHAHIVSGDDDLFVNANASASTVSVEFRHRSHTRSAPAHDLSAWVKQKLRHLSTARYYKPLHKVMLAAEPLSRMIFYISFIILLTRLFLWQYTVAVFGLRLILVLLVYYLNSKKFEEKGLIPFAIIFDFISPVINIILYSATFRNRRLPATWK